MADQPPPYSGIFENQQPYRFDNSAPVNTNTSNMNQSANVANGFINPNDPSKIYVSAPSAPGYEDAPPPSYTDSMNKKKE